MNLLPNSRMGIFIKISLTDLFGSEPRLYETTAMFSFKTDVNVDKTSGDIELSCKIIAEFQTKVLSSMISFTAGRKKVYIKKMCQLA